MNSRRLTKPCIAVAILTLGSVLAVALAADAPDDTRHRERMVAEQIAGRGVKDPRVLAAMAKVARHRFVPADLREEAYNDYPLPIGEGQTISQPYIVALMTEVLALKREDRVLEIGTGSGYQAAILAEICREVCTIEILAPLGERAKRLLATRGGKKKPPSMPSSSPARRPMCPSPWCASWPRAEGWSFPWASAGTRNWCC
jgi:hypothetical protein